jgi:xylose dehydrogenase (NAD/NADP)
MRSSPTRWSTPSTCRCRRAFATSGSSKRARAGKHVYAEKPMADGLEAVLEACRANNVQFMDGTMWYHSIRTRVVEQHLARLGDIRRVTAAFTFAAPDDAWLNGGNGRTNKAQEPLGCFGDQGHYPLSAILFGNNFELPTKVQMLSVTLNSIDTIVAASGFLWFRGGGVASFDCGATLAHRACVEFASARGTVRIDDLVGGDSRTGNFDAYFVPFVGSARFFESDAKGNEVAVPTEPCDHVIALVSDFCDIVLSKTLDDEWPRRSLAVFKTMQALFRSFEQNNSIVERSETRRKANHIENAGNVQSRNDHVARNRVFAEILVLPRLVGRAAKVRRKRRAHEHPHDAERAGNARMKEERANKQRRQKHDKLLGLIGLRATRRRILHRQLRRIRLQK